MVTIETGLLGGFAGTVLMTVAMATLGDDGPIPTALLWAKYVGDEPPEAYGAQGLVLHLLYGTIAGGVFVVVFGLVGTAFGVPVGNPVGGLFWGLVWGTLLFMVAASFWMNVVLEMNPDRRGAVLFGSFHLVYAVGLGLWVSQVGALL